MSASVFKSKRILLLAVSISSVMSLSIYFLLDAFYHQASREVVASWYHNEAVSLQQGNVLSTITKLQRGVSKYSLLRGAVAVDNQARELARVGDVFDPRAIAVQEGEVIEVSTGTFENQFLVRAGDVKIYIYMTSNVLKSVLVGVIFYFLAVLLLASFFFRRMLIQQEELKAELKIKSVKELSHQATQVAHDIRSPLSALNMVMGTLKDIPEEKRILIRGATQRINDIANDLLRKGKDNQAGHTKVAINGSPVPRQVLATEFIPALVDILVSEKRMQFRDQAGLEIEIDLKDSFGSFANISANEIKRVISNLINNAVEAFSQSRGRITVSVRKTSESIEIKIQDNGRGIPEHVLTKLGQPGVSHGKAGTDSGSGIGVYHAKQTLESFGGKLLIESTVGVGTTMRLILPQAAMPTWFADLLDLTGKTRLVSLDDDSSIHQIWSGRLQSLGLNLEHIKIQSGDVFEKFVRENLSQLKNTLFLIDFEFLNQSKTGLDLIEELGLEKYSVLVTSRYEEESIKLRGKKLNLKILPKSLAGFIPIEQRAPRKFYDAILIDDDNLVHLTWQMSARENKKEFLSFFEYNDFLKQAPILDFASPVFVDVHLSNSVSGIDVAEKIHAMGFRNIYLATGYEVEDLAPCAYTKGVTGKDPIWLKA